MAKRSGGELTHDNWDQEEEREDAGTFKTASAGEIKGRVIKRARRRGGADGGDGAAAATEKKNAFAGFGGFSGGNGADAIKSFGSFGKPAESEAPPAGGGFAFGSGSAASAKPVTAFSFGTANVKATTFGSFGSSESKTESVAAAPVFGSLPPAKIDFGASDATKKESDGKTVEPPATKQDFPVLQPETEKPAPPVPSFGIGGEFKFGAATSSAKTSGSLFSFGAASKTEVEDKEVKSTGFSFGINGTKDTSQEVKTGGFSFGPTALSAPPPSEGGFSFGSKLETTANSSSAAAPAFSFGLSTKPTTSTDTFKFGSSETKGSDSCGSDSSGSKQEQQPIMPTFSFGVDKSDSAPVSKTDSAIPTPVLLSASKPDVTTKAASPMFGVAAASTGLTKPVSSVGPVSRISPNSINHQNSDPTPEYLANLKALNTQVMNWLKQHVDANPLVILSPVFKDYNDHLAELEKQEKESKDKSKTEQATVPLGQAAFGGAAAVPALSSTTQPFSFGSSAADKTVNSAAPFSFGQSNSGAATGNSMFSSGGAAAAGAFSFGLTNATTTSNTPAAPAAAEEEDEDNPPVVEVKQVEESDAIYDKKCKLFYKKDGNYVEKGVGMLYLKTVEGGKTQLLIRADTNLGNVLLNILLSPQMPTTRVGKNNVMLVCVPNPPVDPKSDTSEPCPMLIRVKTTDDADELKAKLDENKEEK